MKYIKNTTNQNVLLVRLLQSGIYRLALWWKLKQLQLNNLFLLPDCAIICIYGRLKGGKNGIKFYVEN